MLWEVLIFMLLDSKHEDCHINGCKMRSALIRRHLQVFALQPTA